MTDQWTDRLSEYLDDELAPAERTALEAHLSSCPDCSRTLAELRRVVARARGLEPTGPARDLWPGIAERIGSVRALQRRWSFTLPQLAAAAIALMALSGSAVWLLRPARPAGIAAGAPPAELLPRPDAVVRNASAGTPSGRGYDAAVAELTQVLAAGRGRLDSTTVRVIERNLATIDSAIAQARRAVAADSANLYLNAHLAEAMRRKLELLRQAAALVSTAS